MVHICKKQSSHLCTNLHMWACTHAYLQHHPYGLVGDIIVRSHEAFPPMALRQQGYSEMLSTWFLDIWHLGTPEPGKEVDEATVFQVLVPDSMTCHCIQLRSQVVSLCSSSLSIAGIKTMAGSWGKKGFVSSDNCQLQFTAEEAKAGSQGRNQASRDHTEHCLLSYFLRLVQPAFLYSLGLLAKEWLCP